MNASWCSEISLNRHGLHMACMICKKHLIRGDYVYGACHACARIAIASSARAAQRRGNAPARSGG